MPADGLRHAADQGRVVLAVCGAFQLLGWVYLDGRGRDVPGLGLLELDTGAGGPRLVGEVVIRSREGELLTGFENHGGRSVLGPGWSRWAGSSTAAATTAATAPRGPGRAPCSAPTCTARSWRNPALADLLLAQALARRGRGLGPLQPPGHDRAADLHRVRLQAVLPQHARRQ